MRIVEWLTPVVLGITTLVCILDGGPYTAIVTGTAAGFTLTRSSSSRHHG